MTDDKTAPIENLKPLCDHCGLEIAIRNPSGYCDHLYYPDACKFCKAKHPSNIELMEKEISQLKKEKEELMNALEKCVALYNPDHDICEVLSRLRSKEPR